MCSRTHIHPHFVRADPILMCNPKGIMRVHGLSGLAHRLSGLEPELSRLAHEESGLAHLLSMGAHEDSGLAHLPSVGAHELSGLEPVLQMGSHQTPIGRPYQKEVKTEPFNPPLFWPQ